MTAIHSAATDLDYADRAVERGIESLNANHDAGGTIAIALLGLTKAVTALVRQQGEFYREVVDVLAAAKEGGE